MSLITDNTAIESPATNLSTAGDSFYYSYKTGSQCHVFLNKSSYIGEVAAVTYTLHNSRMPIYSHNSTYFDRMANGQVIVQGMILINLTDFRYMAAAIEASRPGGSNRVQSIVNQLSNKQNLSSITSFGFVDSLTINSIYNQIVGGLSQQTDQTRRNLSISSMNRVSAALSNNPFHISIRIGNPVDFVTDSGDKLTEKVIENCFISGESTEIDAGDGIIMQAFPFIARSIKHGTASNPIVQSGDYQELLLPLDPGPINEGEIVIDDDIEVVVEVDINTRDDVSDPRIEVNEEDEDRARENRTSQTLTELTTTEGGIVINTPGGVDNPTTDNNTDEIETEIQFTPYQANYEIRG